MSAATRKSSQNRRTKIPRFRQRVADSRRDYNSKTADCARKQRARSKEQSAFKFRIQEVSLLVSLFHHSMFPAPCSPLPAPCSLLPAPCSLLFTKTCPPSRDRRCYCSPGLPRNRADLRQRIQSREQTWPLSTHKASG